MSAAILDGKVLAGRLKESLKEEIARLKGEDPTLKSSTPTPGDKKPDGTAPPLSAAVKPGN